MNSNIQSIDIKDFARDGLQELVKKQLENDNKYEHGVSILGTVEGTKVNIHKIMYSKMGNNESVTFEENEHKKAYEEAQKSGLEMLGYGHTHPEDGGDMPSGRDIKSATRSQVSMLLKVNKNGSARIEFFDGEKRNISFTGIDSGKNGKIADIKKAVDGEYDERNHRVADDYGKWKVA